MLFCLVHGQLCIAPRLLGRHWVVTICGIRIESAESAIVKRARAAVRAAMATNDALAVPDGMRPDRWLWQETKSALAGRC